MNALFVFGLALVFIGVVLFAVIEFFLYRWLKNYNNEWIEGDE